MLILTFFSNYSYTYDCSLKITFCETIGTGKDVSKHPTTHAFMQQLYKQVFSLALLHIIGHHSLLQWHLLTFMPIYSL